MERLLEIEDCSNRAALQDWSLNDLMINNTTNIFMYTHAR